MHRFESKHQVSRIHGKAQQRLCTDIMTQPITLAHPEKHHAQKKSLPWLVGYQNSASIQGSPFALAARYGYNGTIRITAQCSDRSIYESENALSMGGREWIPPLLAAPCGINTTEKRCGGSYTSSPKLWPNHLIPPCRYTSTDEMKSKQLLRAVTREQELWNDIASKAKEERQAHCNKIQDHKNSKWKKRRIRNHEDKKHPSNRVKLVMLR